jgi:sugar fermentation stimulation protein A
MRFADPLIHGRLVRRYKRFLSDVELSTGEQVVAHCANPGSMLGLAEPGAEVWLSPARNPARRLSYSWELVAAGSGLVGINTGRPNAIVAEALGEGRIPELSGYQRARREVRYGRNSRVDLLLEQVGRPPCYVEVKNVTLKRGAEAAEFPDAITQRGAKHLAELAEMSRLGARAVMFFLVQRGDCARLEIAGDIDPDYQSAFAAALEHGVEAICYDCHVAPEAIELNRALALAL